MPDTGIVRTSRSHSDLQSWVDHDWSGGIQLDSLAGLEQFAVRTRNSTYEITILSPRTGDVLVRGGRFFPEHTRARVAGCSLGGSFLKVRAIHVGFYLELLHDGRRIVTTGVRQIVPLAPNSPQ
jgi:hypothetical protein